MKKLLVGSVYVNGPRSLQWLGLQLRFLDKTIGPDNYTHAVWLNRIAPDFFKRSVIVGHNTKPCLNVCAEHGSSLNALMRHFNQDTNHENYLILDSDAFPFREAWLIKMQGFLEADPRLPERQFASAVRLENLDTFPHPCAMFIKGTFLKANPEWFDFTGAPGANLIDHRFVDVGCGIKTKKDGQNIWQPLIRTNRWNPHTLLAAVYGNFFYHHGAGSRPFDMRSVASRQLDHVVPRYAHTEMDRRIYAELMKQPEQFMKKLAG